MIRAAQVVALFALSLALSWASIWGLSFTSWMQHSSPEQLATAWLVALLSLAVGALALASIVAAAWMIRDALAKHYHGEAL